MSLNGAGGRELQARRTTSAHISAGSWATSDELGNPADAGVPLTEIDVNGAQKACCHAVIAAEVAVEQRFCMGDTVA